MATTLCFCWTAVKTLLFCINILFSMEQFQDVSYKLYNSTHILTDVIGVVVVVFAADTEMNNKIKPYPKNHSEDIHEM